MRRTFCDGPFCGTPVCPCEKFQMGAFFLASCPLPRWSVREVCFSSIFPDPLRLSLSTRVTAWFEVRNSLVPRGSDPAFSTDTF